MVSVKEKDFIFECRKCGHEVYCSKEKLDSMIKYDCPECGEEYGRIWILIGRGHFSK